MKFEENKKPLVIKGFLDEKNKDVLTVFKSYKYRLYPNKLQQDLIAKAFGCSRKIWNLMLADKIAYYKTSGKNIYVAAAKYKKMSEYYYLNDVDGTVLTNAEFRLDRTFKNFLSKLKKDKSAELPRFKSRKLSRESYCSTNFRGSVCISGNRIRLPKIGFVRMVMHRPMKNCAIKSVTVSKTRSGKYYASIMTEYENQVLPIIPKKFVGLDFAMHGLYVDSEGKSAEYPGFYRKSMKRLAKLHRRLSRTEKSSLNHEKMRIKLARLHERVANQRNDFLHKKARYLADRFDCVAVEDISVKAMSKRKNGNKFRLGKSVNDNGWARFVEMLSYKLEWQGKSLVKIDKWFPSSQLCHCCGYQTDVTKNLSVREWTCPKCGSHHNRDHNAAINIRNEGRRIALN